MLIRVPNNQTRGDGTTSHELLIRVPDYQTKGHGSTGHQLLIQVPNNQTNKGATNPRIPNPDPSSQAPDKRARGSTRHPALIRAPNNQKKGNGDGAIKCLSELTATRQIVSRDHVQPFSNPKAQQPDKQFCQQDREPPDAGPRSQRRDKGGTSRQTLFRVTNKKTKAPRDHEPPNDGRNYQPSEKGTEQTNHTMPTRARDKQTNKATQPRPAKY